MHLVVVAEVRQSDQLLAVVFLGVTALKGLVADKVVQGRNARSAGVACPILRHSYSDRVL